MVRASRLALPAAALLVIAGCGANDQAASGSGDKIKIVASTNVWGSVAQAVGGDKVEVTSLIDSPQKDPHDYESSAQDTSKIADAKLVVLNGGGYDEFMTKAVAGVGGKIPVVNAFDLAGRKGDDVNEHVFYDLPTVKKTADAIAEKLTTLQPDRKADFTAAASKFDGAVDSLITKAKKIGAGKKVNAVATEGVADYLLETAGVHNVTPEAFAAAVEKEQDIPAAAVAQMSTLLASKKAQLLVDNTQTDTDTVQQLRDKAKSAGIGIAPVTETFPEGTSEYVPWMAGEIDEMSKAVSGK